MHARNGDKPYASCADAMSYWVETETAVGVGIKDNDELYFAAPFALEQLLRGTISLNHKRPKPDAFSSRINRKRWLELWPKLVIIK